MSTKQNFPKSTGSTRDLISFCDCSDQFQKKSLKSTNFRWIALILLNLALAGNYFCYDMPQALQEPLQKHLRIDAKNYNNLYTVDGFPIILMPILGSGLIQLIGVRYAFIFFASLIAFGQTFVCLGAYYTNFDILCWGRVIYRSGGDCLVISQTFFIIQWFPGKELAFAFSFQNVIQGLSSALNANMTPRLYNSTEKLATPLICGLILCLTSTISAISMGILDFVNSYLEKQPSINFIIKAKESFNLKQIFYFPLLYWLIIINYALQNNSFFSFTNVANNYLVVRYGYNSIQAGIMLSICIYGVSAFFPPLWGKIIDSYGRRVTLMKFAALLPLIAHLIFFISSDCKMSESLSS